MRCGRSDLEPAAMQVQDGKRLILFSEAFGRKTSNLNLGAASRSPWQSATKLSRMVPISDAVSQIARALLMRALTAWSSGVVCGRSGGISFPQVILVYIDISTVRYFKCKASLIP